MTKPRGKQPQAAAPDAADANEETLDQAIAKLETIVRQLEVNDVDLDRAHAAGAGGASGPTGAGAGKRCSGNR